MGKKRNLEGLGHTLASLEAQAPRIKGDERGIGLCLQREWDRGRAHSLAALGAQAPRIKGDEREPKGGLEGQGGIRKDKNLRL